MSTKKNKSGKGKRFDKDDSGVSAVIGVILMVAITVVMAAIVSSWSSGVKAPNTPTTVGLDIARSSSNISITVTSIDPASAAPIPSINFSTSGASCTITNMSSANVGQSTTLTSCGDITNLVRLIVTATYKDGTQKVLYSRET